jgi:hypothetical protein
MDPAYMFLQILNLPMQRNDVPVESSSEAYDFGGYIYSSFADLSTETGYVIAVLVLRNGERSLPLSSRQKYRPCGLCVIVAR